VGRPSSGPTPSTTTTTKYLSKLMEIIWDGIVFVLMV
jgi:hypothetical protein